jgi:hypothetical protein
MVGDKDQAAFLDRFRRAVFHHPGRAIASFNQIIQSFSGLGFHRN